MVKHIKVFRGV